MSHTFTDRAMPLAEKGVPVFPCGTNKQPRVPGGFKAATTDPAQVAEWGRKYPDALVAMPTGGKVFVLDVDVDPAKSIDGFATMRSKGWEVPATRTHRTRRGGAHYIFRMPEGLSVRNSAGVLGAGLDVRGEGGYVIRWDAHGGEVEHPGMLTAPPAWLVAALGSTPAPRITTPGGAERALATINDDLSAGLPQHEAIGEGGRNHALTRMAGGMRARGMDAAAISAALLVENETRCAPPLPPEEVLAIAQSVARYEPDPRATDEAQTIARLAALSPLEYERARETEAERLGVRVTTLDALIRSQRAEDAPKAEAPFEEVEPWAEPVDGALLLAEIATAIRRFIVCDPETLVASTLWCAAAWLADSVNTCPILLINAPEKACGKTQLLSVVGKLVPRPAQAAGISPSVLFRMIERYHPTLLVDEIETVLTKEAEDLRGLFNAGHTRDSAYVWRSVAVGDDFEPMRFGVFGFKAIAGINADRLAETVTSRSILAQLRRRLPHESVQRLRHAPADLFPTLQRKLARWAMDSASAVEAARPEQPEALSDREQDNWEPLFAVADAAAGVWPRLARAAAVRLSAVGKESGQSMGATLLSDIRDAFAARGTTRLSTYDLIATLCADEEAPWATWARGQRMTPRNLATMLGKYGIKTTSVRTGAGQTPKGYKLEQFEDAFERYLIPSGAAPEKSATTQQTSTGAGCSVVKASAT